MPASEVREKFKRVKPLKDISVTQRGWTLDVLNIVRRLISEGRALRDPNFGKMGARITRPSDSFTTADVYAFERELEKLHPDNRHVRDKIRQQLQVLRDLGLVFSEGRAPRDPNFSGQSGTRITRPSDSFTTADVNAFERELEKLQPGATEGNKGNKVWKPFHRFVSFARSQHRLCRVLAIHRSLSEFASVDLSWSGTCRELVWSFAYGVKTP